MLGRASLNLLLAFLLLLAQQFAAAHTLTHRDQGSVPPHACQLCAVSAPLGAGLPSAPPALHATSHFIEQHPYLASGFSPTLRLAFHSRAPPSAPL